MGISCATTFLVWLIMFKLFLGLWVPHFAFLLIASWKEIESFDENRQHSVYVLLSPWKCLKDSIKLKEMLLMLRWEWKQIWIKTLLMIKKHINIIVSLPTAGVSVYHSVVVLKWTISSYPVFPSALLVNFLGTCYVSFKIFNRRSVLKQTYMSILYANAWFPYLIRFSLSVKKSWFVSSFQNFQYIT